MNKTMWMKCPDDLVNYTQNHYVIIKDTSGIYHILMEQRFVKCDKDEDGGFSVWNNEEDDWDTMKTQWMPLNKQTELTYVPDKLWDGMS